MGKDKEFENILNDCLDRLFSGEDIASCLARYPEHASELEPLLKTALETKSISTIKPRPEFRQRAGTEFQKAIAEMPVKALRSPFKWQLRWVIPVAVFLVLFSGFAGTVVAATNSLPDSPLYGLKMAWESVQMTFTFSVEGKAELYARFVDYRVEEIVKMAEAGEYAAVEQATERMNSQLLAIADLYFSGEEAAQEGAMLSLAAGSQEAPPELAAPAPTTPPETTEPATTPPLEKSPPVVVTEAPPVPGRDTAADNAGGGLSETDRLRQLLTEKYQQNLALLQEQLAKAPEALKPAIQQAIQVLEEGYQLALAAL